MLKTLRKTLHFRKQHSRWQKKYDPVAPKMGDITPDFELWDVNGKHSIRLADFHGRKAVALVFGSFT